jgi:hypothetical protein
MKTNSLKSVVVAVVASSVLVASPVFALSTVETDTISKAIHASKVVDVSGKAAKLVSAAAKESKSDVAVAVVSAAIKSHPSTIGSVIVSVLKVSPESTEAVVVAALEAAPQSALTILAAAAEGAPAYADKAVAVASAKLPTRASAFEREVAVVKGRRVVESVAFEGTPTTEQTARTSPAPTQAYGQTGSAPERTNP